MNKWQLQVFDFHQKCELPGHLRPTPVPPSTMRLRKKLIREEIKELNAEFELAASFPEGVVAANLPEIAKEIVDSIYVLVGFAVTLGVDLDPVFDAVHESNMAKADGPKRSDGKQLKPEGWQKPDIAAVIDAQR